jgi:hypothetical protein
MRRYTRYFYECTDAFSMYDGCKTCPEYQTTCASTVERCRLTVSTPELTPRLVSVLEAII